MKYFLEIHFSETQVFLLINHMFTSELNVY